MTTTAKLEEKAARLEEKLAQAREAEAARLTAEADADAGAATEQRRPARRRLVALALALGLVAVVLAAIAVPYAIHERGLANRANQLDATRASAEQAASAYAVDFGSYDYSTLQADFARVSSHLTPDFAKNYSSVASKLESVIKQYKGKSVGTVQGVAITSVTKNSAVALVFLDQTVTTTQSDASRIDRNRMQMTMVRQSNGSWLISDLQLK